MNISASNQSLENIIIRQEKEKKRPSFASVFEKINKRTSNMNRITPLNNKLTNEQLFRYYLKETDPKLRVSDDAFGEDETTLADLITNRSLNKSKVNQTLQTDDGDDDGGKDDDESARNVDEYFRIVEEINDEKQQDQSQSFVDRSSFLKDAGTEASKQLENSIRPADAVKLTDFMKNYDLEKTFNEMDGSPFNKKEAARRHGGDLLYEIAQNNAELGFVNNEYRDDINPMYEGTTNDFVSSLVGNIADGISRNSERLQNSLMEAGVDVTDVREMENISPIKRTRTIKPVPPTELVNQLVGAKTYSKPMGPELLGADWEDNRYGGAPKLYYLMRGQKQPWSDEDYRQLEEPLWRPTDRKGNWKDWAVAKYDKHDWYDDTVLDRASTAISSAVKGHAVRNRIREVKGIVNDLVADAASKGKVMNKETVINPNTGRSVARTGVVGKKLLKASSTINQAIKMKIAKKTVEKAKAEVGSLVGKNKPITPTNMRTRSSKARNPETEGFV
jgi:hypothetical protein